jgi:hypothetical protein
MKEQSLRYNTGKPELSYILDVMPALKDMVAVMEFGGKKYERNNWQRGFPREKLLDSMLRHVDAFYSGEDVDPESGLPHVGHILCNAAFLGYHFGSSSEYWDKNVEGEELEKEALRNSLADEQTLEMTQMTESMISKMFGNKIQASGDSLRVGDLVRVRDFEEIYTYPDQQVKFADEMKELCGNVYPVNRLVKSIDAYEVNDWSFLREWLEKV